MPRFSIIVIGYNIADLIGNAINSVISQNYHDYEVIVVDDGSTDNTGEVAEKLANERITVVHQENRGVGGARNTGIEKAKGEYIVFLDGDDILTDESVLYEVDRVIGNKKPDLVYTGFRTLENGKVIKSYIPTLENAQWEKEMLGDRIIIAAAKIYNRQFLINKGLRFIEGIYHEDEHFTFITALHANEISVVEKITYDYITQKGSITNRGITLKHLKSLACLTEKMICEAEKAGRWTKTHDRALQKADFYAGLIKERLKIYHSKTSA